MKISFSLFLSWMQLKRTSLRNHKGHTRNPAQLQTWLYFQSDKYYIKTKFLCKYHTTGETNIPKEGIQELCLREKEERGKFIFTWQFLVDKDHLCATPTFQSYQKFITFQRNSTESIMSSSGKICWPRQMLLHF